MDTKTLAEHVTSSPLHLLQAVAPLLLAVGIFAAIYIGLRRLLAQRQNRGAESRYRQQGFTALLVGLFLLTAIIVAPISDSLRGQLLSLFGIVVSATIALSSTTVMGNLIAGFMLRAVSRLHAGDFIRTEHQFGRITERGLLHIEIQTEESDLTTLPNLTLVQQPFTLIRASGTIISAEVSLGYDVNRLDAESALLKAAENAGLDEAFVQIRSLGDFSVLYRLCGRLTNVLQIVSRRSQLRAAMLDALHAAGIEIVSPTFMNQRRIDGQRFVPAPPKTTAMPDNGDAANIEELLFDKAEKARLAERAHALDGAIAAKIEQLTKEKSALPRDDAEARAEIQQRIDHYSRRADRMKVVLEEIEADKRA